MSKNYGASRINDFERNRIIELGATKNAVEISKETKRSVAAVRDTLRAAGIEPLRWCIYCEQNLPADKFSSKKRMICDDHKGRPKNKPSGPFIQDYNEHLAQIFLREVKPLQELWPATNPGEFRSPYVGQ